MRSSTEPATIRSWTNTGLVWPMRCARSVACACAAGFHHGIVVDHGVGAGQVEPGAARLEADQEHVGAAAAGTRRSASGDPGVLPVSVTWPMPRASSASEIRPSMRANCEKIEDAAAVGELLA